jgi:hypothetical protein
MRADPTIVAKIAGHTPNYKTASRFARGNCAETVRACGDLDHSGATAAGAAYGVARASGPHQLEDGTCFD